MKFKSCLVVTAAAIAPALIPANAVHSAATVDEKGFVTLLPGQEQWSDYPGIPGIKIMVVDGDPKKAGPYVIRVKFGPGTMSMPHFHPEDRLVTVIKGTWWMGKGENFTPAETVPMPAGTFAKHPAKEAHFDGAKEEEVIVQIAGVGPSATTFFKLDLGSVGKSLPNK